LQKYASNIVPVLKAQKKVMIENAIMGGPLVPSLN
jgi:hypothetical protein